VDRELEEELRALVRALTRRYQPDARREVKALKQAGGTSRKAIVEIVGDRDKPDEVREVACWVVSRLEWEGAVPALVAAMGDNSPVIRRASALALGDMGASEAVPVLIRALEYDTIADVRYFAAIALGNIGDERAVEALMVAVANEDEEPEVRGVAAGHLGTIEEQPAVRALMATEQDPHVQVSFWKAYAHRHIGDRRAVAELRRLAKNDAGEAPGSGAVRAEVQQALRDIERAKRWVRRMERRHSATT
jgi:HEAT repeat protein